jgi:hypothetical protein
MVAILFTNGLDKPFRSEDKQKSIPELTWSIPGAFARKEEETARLQPAVAAYQLVVPSPPRPQPVCKGEVE